MRVFIGVGHGGSDSGANSYVCEKEANLTIALELRDQLEAYGIEVGMSRTKDENDPIGEEIREANAFFAGSTDTCLAVEVHNNAGGGDGWECFVQTNKYAKQSRACAEAIEAEVKAIGQNSRGIKTKVFGWTYNVKAPAVLLEGFFVDKWEDAKDFDTVEEQKALARAYARGVLKYLGITEKPVESKPVETYRVEAVGEFTNKAKAEVALENVKKLGFTGSLVSIGGTVATAKELKVGATVRVKAGAKYYDGKTPKDFVYKRDHKVKSISGDRVTITYLGIVIGNVHKNNLTVV